jgi:hypothetical protein
LGSVAALAVAAVWVAFAQVGGTPVRGGNPTPGTAQPEPPNLADRITLSGCLRLAPGRSGQGAPADANDPSDARFVLTGTARVTRVPPGTGGSAVAAGPIAQTLRLDGLDSQFSPFVDTKVEISGEIKMRPAGAAAERIEPTLLVEFVQKIAPRC